MERNFEKLLKRTGASQILVPSDNLQMAMAMALEVRQLLVPLINDRAHGNSGWQAHFPGVRLWFSLQFENKGALDRGLLDRVYRLNVIGISLFMPSFCHLHLSHRQESRGRRNPFPSMAASEGTYLDEQARVDHREGFAQCHERLDAQQ